MAWPSLMLRMPRADGSLDLREVFIPSGAPRALAIFCAQISSPEAVAELRSQAGRRCEGWLAGAGRLWEDAGWPGEGAATMEAWLDLSRRRTVEGWEAGGRSRPARDDDAWAHGGWAWCPERSCWMAQVLSVGGAGQPSGFEHARIGLQPAALTVWQWDNDMLATSEGHSPEIGVEALIGMCESMRAPALREMRAALSGHFKAPGAAEWIRSMIERSDLDGSCREASAEGEPSRI